MQERVNNLMVLYRHQNRLDRLDLTLVAQGFIDGIKADFPFFFFY